VAASSTPGRTPSTEWNSAMVVIDTPHLDGVQ
jgi:hypothetical protein